MLTGLARRRGTLLLQLLPWALLLLRGVAAETRAADPAGGYSALCVVAKNENLYVAEWLDYHKCLGFSHIYLYDHNSTVPLRAAAAPHIASGFVTYTAWGGTHTRFSEGYSSSLDRFLATAQGLAYQHCIDTYGPRHTFVGFIDVDEFLVLYDTSLRSVDDLLRRYEQHAALSVYWILLGSNGHRTRPQAPVVNSYTACVPATSKYNTQFKSFVNTAYRPLMYSPHRAKFRLPSEPDAHAVEENHIRIAAGRNKNSTHTLAAVHHYATKSAEDFQVKRQRGGGAGVSRPGWYLRVLDKIGTDTCHAAEETQARMCALTTEERHRRHHHRQHH